MSNRAGTRRSSAIPGVVQGLPLSAMDVIALCLAAYALFRLRKLSRQLEALRREVGGARVEAAGPPADPSAGEAGAGRRLSARQRPRGRLATALAGVRRSRRAAAATGSAARSVNWMVWLGGVSVALAGVFLVKYSIDQGLLTPWARVIAGLLAGCGMHWLAEWLVRRAGAGHPALAALAGAGSTTLCAAALAALHLYDLVPSYVAFLFIAAVSLATLALEPRHGAVLGVLGLGGSYGVPLFVGGGSDGIVGVLLYCLIVSGAALLLAGRRFRISLWAGMLLGSMFWMLASLPGTQADGYRGPYIAVLAGAMLALPSVDWQRGRLGRLHSAGAVETTRLPPAAIPVGLLVLTLAQGLAAVTEPFSLVSAAGWTPLVVLLLLAGRRFPKCSGLPWVWLVLQAMGWVAASVRVEGLELVWREPQPAVRAGFPFYAAWMAAVFAGFSIGNLRLRRPAPQWASLATVAPACWLGLAFVVATDRAVSPAWAAAGVAIGGAWTAAGWTWVRRGLDAMASWAILGCAGAYSVAAAILFRDASLTLALAAQAVPLAWLAARFGGSTVAWLVKAVLAATVVRLTFNRWLPSYEEAAGWTWWTYGGSALAGVAAGRLARPLPGLRRWIEAAAVHLLVLASWAVTREWLYGEAMFESRYGLRDAAVNTVVWGGLGLAYLGRMRASEHLGGLYRWVARVLLVLALGNHCIVLTALNPIGGLESVGPDKVWNILLLAYGAPVALALLAVRFGEPGGSRPAGLAAAVSAFVFVNLEVRHLWQGALAWSPVPGDGEMATYSIAWLAMAVGCMLAGGMRFGPSVYRIGMVLLLLTACKVFLVDASGLTGLLRAGSFLGLGLSLLGLAYLHRRLSRLRVPVRAEDCSEGADLAR